VKDSSGKDQVHFLLAKPHAYGNQRLLRNHFLDASRRAASAAPRPWIKLAAETARRQEK
jgi:hypothetical protein